MTEIALSALPPAGHTPDGSEKIVGIQDGNDVLLDIDDVANRADPATIGAIPASDIDTDTTLAANSNALVPSQRAVKSFVNNKLNGRTYKQAVRAASTVAGTLATDFANGHVVDGVTLATNDRLLLKDQADATQNGIYVVQATGAPVRAGDANTATKLLGATCVVKLGTANESLQFTNSSSPITLGTTPLVFIETGSTDSFTADEVTLHLDGLEFSVLPDGIGTTELADESVTPVKQSQISAGVIVGNDSGSAAAPMELDAARVKALLTITIGDITGLGTAAALDVDTDAAMTADSDALVPSQKAVRSYILSQLDGRSWKQAVRAATTANGTLATAFANGSVIDGVTLATGDRILLKNQTTGSENGLYIVAASGAPARSSDADTGAELVNATVEVQEGTLNADLQYTCSTNAPITIGTTALVFILSGGGGSSYTADETSLHLAGSQFQIKSTWNGQTAIDTVGTITVGTWNGTVIGNSYIASALTGKTYNGLTLTAVSVGFTIAGGTTSKTLTVSNNADVSGANTGDQTSVSGNAGTATALQTARTINGVSFDGTANISIPTGAPSIQSIVSTNNIIPTFSDDEVKVTALATNATLVNPTGTAIEGWGMVVRIKDDGTIRTLSYGSQYRAADNITLPVATVIGKTLYLVMVYNDTDTKWDVLAIGQVS